MDCGAVEVVDGDVKTALDRWVLFLNKAGSLSRSSLPEQHAADPAVGEALGEFPSQF